MTAASYSLVRTAADVYGLAPNASGTVSLAWADSLSFSGLPRFRGNTHFTYSGLVLTLTNPEPEDVTFPNTGTFPVTARLVCRVV